MKDSKPFHSSMEYTLADIMVLNNIHIIGRDDNPSRIEISGSRIISIDPIGSDSINSQQEIILDFGNAIAFPGLINSHDHLEFNLFPKLGNKIYNDYVEWGIDIHTQNKAQIEKILRIPYNLKFQLGLYKNLICGVTTVAHHGNGKTFILSNMPDIISDYNYIHSVRLEKNWRSRLNFSINSKPFVIHLGEGTNWESIDEVNELIKWNLLRKKIIGVHGISLNDRICNKLEALVWCPGSNIFLYNQTANIAALKNHTAILFGTDSTLSADWNFWNHLRLARAMNYLSDKELYNSITETASKIWHINYSGSISVDNIADIVISTRKDKNQWESFFNINPEDILLILKNGKIILIDKKIADDQSVIDQDEYDSVSINSYCKFITKGIRELIHSIRLYLPEYSCYVTAI